MVNFSLLTQAFDLENVIHTHGITPLACAQASNPLLLIQLPGSDLLGGTGGLAGLNCRRDGEISVRIRLSRLVN